MMTLRTQRKKANALRALRNTAMGRKIHRPDHLFPDHLSLDQLCDIAELDKPYIARDLIREVSNKTGIPVKDIIGTTH